jgi:hypothetical protein
VPILRLSRRAATAALLVVASLPTSAARSFAQSASPQKKLPTVDSLDAISYRGYLLAKYDAAAWIASDSVVARKPDPASIRGYVARQVGEDQWAVAFGRLSAGRDTFFTAYEAVQRANDARVFDVRAFTPARADTGYYARASRAMALARETFGPQTRAYNSAVIDRPNGLLWVYLFPAQTQNGVYPLGADTRYLFSADGRTILATRRLHNALIEFAPRKRGDDAVVAGTQTAVLDDIPEDTDVFHVLVRQPRVPQIIVTDEFMWRVTVDGDIEYLGRRPDEYRNEAKSAP